MSNYKGSVESVAFAFPLLALLQLLDKGAGTFMLTTGTGNYRPFNEERGGCLQPPLQNPHEFCKVSILYPKDEQPFCYQGSAQYNCTGRRAVLELETETQDPWRQAGRRQESAVMSCSSTAPCSALHDVLQMEEEGDEQVASTLGIPALYEYRAFLDLESSWA